MEPFSGARLPCLQRTWTQNTVQPFAPCPLGEYCERQLQTKSLAFQRFYNCNIETNYWLCFGALSTRSHLIQYHRDCFFLFSELCLIHNWKKKKLLYLHFSFQFWKSFLFTGRIPSFVPGSRPLGVAEVTHFHLCEKNKVMSWLIFRDPTPFPNVRPIQPDPTCKASRATFPGSRFLPSFNSLWCKNYC